jgi:hypothetical protein
MTAALAGRFRRIDRGRGHSYTLDGHRLPGVTTILDSLRKRALEEWAGNITAAYAIDHWDELGAVGPAARLDTLKRARYEVRDAAALTGTEVHALAWPLVTGAEVEVPPRHMGAVQALARFMDAWHLEPVATERPVFHPAHGWAGTFDLLAGIGGTLWLLDYKTGRGVYPETALQLAAYAHAAYMLPEGGGEPVEWVPPERCGAVHITADSAELLPIDWAATEEAYTVFRYVAQASKWAERVAAARKDGDPWPIGAALAPSPVGVA